MWKKQVLAKYANQFHNGKHRSAFSFKKWIAWQGE